MKTIDVVNKTREYINYVEEHIKNVGIAWSAVCENCQDMRFVYDDYVYSEIATNIGVHDISKLSREEFVGYRQFFYPVDKTTEKDKDIFNLAWEHHKTKNDHHWEVWTTKKYWSPYAQEIFCVEMVCDWIAMGIKFGDTAKDYYEKNKEEIKLPDWAITLIYEIFDRVYDSSGNFKSK